jgi:hypothetical protein
LKKIIFSFITTLLTSISLAGVGMNLEGTCQGQNSEKTEVSFTYFSNFDGCMDKSQAALVFTEGEEGLFTGQRSFTDNHDIYSFTVSHNGKKTEIYRVWFDNMTSRSKGTMRYLNEESGKSEIITLQCLIRDYHYLEC